MTNRVTYEWVAEYVDEHADIVDHVHADVGQLDVLLNQCVIEKHSTLRIEFAVQRFERNELDGIVDRSYAYFDNDGVLEECCGDFRVPAYVRKEAERHAERVRQLTDYME